MNAALNPSWVLSGFKAHQQCLWFPGCRYRWGVWACACDVCVPWPFCRSSLRWQHGCEFQAACTWRGL